MATPSDPRARAASRRAALPAVPAPAGELRVLGLLGSTTRAADGELPARVAVRAILADTTLDLREAVFPPSCVVDIGAWGASLVIVVPPGVRVTTSAFSFASAFQNDATHPQEASAARVHVEGTALFANVEIRVVPPGAPIPED